jgi:hypothetical protein
LGDVVILQQLFVLSEDVLRNLIAKEEDGLEDLLFPNTPVYFPTSTSKFPVDFFDILKK